jgi:precorrin-3B synthase
MKTRRRGACPEVRNPMLTGDGWLVRWIPREPLSIRAFTALCDASEKFGNGVMEITQRGSLQIRGLTLESAASLADTMEELGLDIDTTPVILTPPLLGRDNPQGMPASLLATQLRVQLSGWSGAARLSPKASLLVDGDTALHLDRIAADVRLRVVGDRAHIAFGGDARTAIPVGWASFADAIAVTVAILDRLSAMGPEARARDLGGEQAAESIRKQFATGIAATPTANRPAPTSAGPGAPLRPATPLRTAPEPIATHALCNGTFAQGLALPFGYSSAAALKDLALAANSLGASELCTAPDRTLLAVGLTSESATALQMQAAKLGFVVRATDPRRYVVACAGSPVCASAFLSTRELAPRVAQAARNLLGPGSIIHLSGCPKGCAHSKAATLTLVGPRHLVIRGRADDPPAREISPTEFVADLERLNENWHGEPGASASAVLSRVGFARPANVTQAS